MRDILFEIRKKYIIINKMDILFKIVHHLEGIKLCTLSLLVNVMCSALIKKCRCNKGDIDFSTLPSSARVQGAEKAV